MQRNLDTRDRQKLDEYLTGVREIESRIERVERLGDAVAPGVEAPAGIPETFEEYIAMMGDLMVLAFQTDSTRVATLQLAHDGSNHSFDQIGISEGHHELWEHFGITREALIEAVNKLS